MECFLLKISYIATTTPPYSNKVDYYTVIKKESDCDTTSCYYVLFNKGGHIFKKRLSKNLVSRLLRSGRFSCFDYYNTDGEFIESVKSMYCTIMECTILFRYNS